MVAASTVAGRALGDSCNYCACRTSGDDLAATGAAVGGIREGVGVSIAAGGAGAVVAVVGLAVGTRSGGSGEVEGTGAAAINGGMAVGAAGAVGELVSIRVAAHLP
jgi:hypothetical protein